MMYKCPNCGYSSEQPGNCPTCNVPMKEEAAPANGEPAPDSSQPPASPNAGQ